MKGFLAFGVSAASSAVLTKIFAGLPPAGLRAVDPTDYHVTIKFLSEFSSTDFFASLPEITELGNPPVASLRAGDLALWPTVLALECDATDELRAWHGEVNRLLERKGFLRERHPRFLPHVTLARRTPGKRLPELEARLEKAHDALRGQSIELEKPALWKTEPDGTGRSHLPFLSPLFRRIGS